MPIIAIGAAALAVGTATTGILAAGLTVVTALETVAAVGATLGAIGAVTGDKTLGTIGMVMGAVGGIGSIAASAGLFGADAASGASLFGDSASVTAPDIAGEAAAGNDLSGLSALPGLGTSAGASAGASSDVFAALDPAGSAVSAAAGTSVPPGAAGIVSPDTAAATNFGTPAQDTLSQNLLPSGSPATAGLNPASSSIINSPPPAAVIPQGATAAGAQAPVAPGAPVPQSVAAPNAPTIANDVSGLATTPSLPTQTDPSMLGTLGKFAKDNPLVAYGVIQAAGSFISGATNPLTPAQVSALNAQAAQNQAAANVTKQQGTNMAQPIPVATRSTSGLINIPANNNTVPGQATS